ncbi:MAG TPA: hypothetical protein VML75_10575 [Kofleriaceae bacterium]|nr:hypothetical protein [Kofleriaceae bacterium]
MADSFPAATAHGPIEEVFPEVFLVRGTMRYPHWKMVLARNMIIVRTGTELTLFNSVRLDAAGELALEGLGTVTHLVKLGAFHGVDDPYYVDRYRPTLWAPPEATHKGELTTDRVLDEDGDSPVPGATLFRFACAALPEVAVRLPVAGGTLLTCDAVTNMIDHQGCEGVESQVTREHGFLRPASIGAMWRNAMTREHGPSLLLDYRRLLEQIRFVNLISAHGPPLRDTAATDLTATLQFIFGAKVTWQQPLGPG